MIHSMGGGEKGKAGAKGQDSEGDLHIINQLRKIVDLDIPLEVKFLDKSYMTVDVEVAAHCLRVYEGLRTSIAKDGLTTKLWANNAAISSVSEICGMINTNKNNKKGRISHESMDLNG